MLNAVNQTQQQVRQWLEQSLSEMVASSELGSCFVDLQLPVDASLLGVDIVRPSRNLFLEFA